MTHPTSHAAISSSCPQRWLLLKVPRLGPGPTAPGMGPRPRPQGPALDSLGKVSANGVLIFFFLRSKNCRCYSNQ